LTASLFIFSVFPVTPLWFLFRKLANLKAENLQRIRERRKNSQIMIRGRDVTLRVVDRYVLIVHVHGTSDLSYRADVRKVVLFVAALWICVSALNVPTMMAHTTKTLYNITYCGIENRWIAPILLSFSAFGYAVPLVVIAVIYVIIVRFLRTQRPTTINQQPAASLQPAARSQSSTTSEPPLSTSSQEPVINPQRPITINQQRGASLLPPASHHHQPAARSQSSTTSEPPPSTSSQQPVFNQQRLTTDHHQPAVRIQSSTSSV